MLDAADVAKNETVDRALYAERNRAVEICGPLIEKVFLKKSPFTAAESEQKYEFLRDLYNELHVGKLRKISEVLK